MWFTPSGALALNLLSCTVPIGHFCHRKSATERGARVYVERGNELSKELHESSFCLGPAPIRHDFRTGSVLESIPYPTSEGHGSCARQQIASYLAMCCWLAKTHRLAWGHNVSRCRMA